jgi:hypothetical protein
MTTTILTDDEHLLLTTKTANFIQSHSTYCGWAVVRLAGLTFYLLWVSCGWHGRLGVRGLAWEALRSTYYGWAVGGMVSLTFYLSWVGGGWHGWLYVLPIMGAFVFDTRLNSFATKLSSISQQSIISQFAARTLITIRHLSHRAKSTTQLSFKSRA